MANVLRPSSVWARARSGRAAAGRGGRPRERSRTQRSLLRPTDIQSPFRVWIVAPVLMPTLSAVGVGPSGAKLKSYRRRSIASATVASSSANWSPTHLRGPPPKGRYAKSAATSLGYSWPFHSSGLKPFHSGLAPLWKGRRNRSGSKASGLSQYLGDRCRLYTEMKMSELRSSLTGLPKSLPFAGISSSSMARRISRGGSGYIRRDSATHRRTSSSFIMSSMTGFRSPITSSISLRTFASTSGA
mmetsp:Transcript_67000/g.188686  ORF Transcript_67000/g.188686 Transcript_67000/m.188686 type:complete len:244 (-) Transcript_67000:1209-1940(-)